MIHYPTMHDVPDLARIHVQDWAETYSGLLPDAEIQSYDIALRTAQWRNQIENGTTTIAYSPGMGFAQSGPQRDKALAKAGYPFELYAIYLLRTAQGRGLGSELFEAVRPKGAFTALVLDGNAGANNFYERRGGTIIDVRPEMVGNATIIERVYGWREA